MIFQDRDDCAAYGDGGAVEGVGEMRSFFPFDSIPNVESTGLVVGAVGGAGHFAPFATVSASWHPSFEIVFAIGWPTEVSGGCIDDAVGDFEKIEQFALDLA